mmetsp:Transcript_5973/g.5285  ORF Transcript_5973/g.5285 Transcript_5973/m.5285 type:complete len:153 (+) Transcript_5973:511-969(+)
MMAPEPFRFKAEKARQTFLPEYKQMWEKAESLLILTFLHHSGLLKLIVNEKGEVTLRDDAHTQDQLKVAGQRRNDVINWMVDQVQAEKEWQHILTEISEARNKYLADKKKAAEEEERLKKEKEEQKKKDEDKDKKAPKNSTSSLPAKKGSKI